MINLNPQNLDFVMRRNNVRIRGQGARTIVFGHGFGCDQNVWRWITPAFEEDCRVVSFDQVGAGQSDISAYEAAKYDSLSGYVQDLLEIYASVGLSQTIYVGHSVGAMIGLLAAIKAPGLFERLVLIAPSPCYVNDDNYVGGFTAPDMDELLNILEENFVTWSASMAPVIMNSPQQPSLSSELASSFCRMDPVIAKQFARVTFLSDCRAHLKLLNIPSLILQCRDDAIAPIDVGNYMREQMPKSKLHLMGATGHCPHMSAPDETIAAIRAFL